MGKPRARENPPKPSLPANSSWGSSFAAGTRLGTAPRTCGVAVAGLAGSLRLPAVVVLPAALAVGPGRVVAAVAAVSPVPAAPEQLPVIGALLGAAAAVAGWGRGRRTGEDLAGTGGYGNLLWDRMSPERPLGSAVRAFGSASALGSRGGCSTVHGAEGCTRGVKGMGSTGGAAVKGIPGVQILPPSQNAAGAGRAGGTR